MNFLIVFFLKIPVLNCFQDSTPWLIIDWLIGSFIDWFIDSLIHWLIDSFIDSFIDSLIDSLIFYRGEAGVELKGAEAEVAADYTKKKHVYRLR